MGISPERNFLSSAALRAHSSSPSLPSPAWERASSASWKRRSPWPAGILARRILRGMVIELSQAGITKGFVLNDRFVGHTTVVAWSAIQNVHTDWRHPGDDTGLATTVAGADGHTIHFTTLMGLRAYWNCLATVAANTPASRHSGLTEALLASDPPDGRQVISTAATAATLALVLVAFVGVHYLWAQGRSSLARSLEQNGVESRSSGATGPAAPPYNAPRH